MLVTLHTAFWVVRGSNHSSHQSLVRALDAYRALGSALQQLAEFSRGFLTRAYRDRRKKQLHVFVVFTLYLNSTPLNVFQLRRALESP